MYSVCICIYIVLLTRSFFFLQSLSFFTHPIPFYQNILVKKESVLNSYQNILVKYNYTILIIGLDITFRYDILKVEIAEVLKGD